MAKRDAQPEPIEIVDLDAMLKSESLTPAEAATGQSFWFGELGVFNFADGTSYHARAHRDFITDPALIENIKTVAQNPTLKIFIE